MSTSYKWIVSFDDNNLNHRRQFTDAQSYFLEVVYSEFTFLLTTAVTTRRTETIL